MFLSELIEEKKYKIEKNKINIIVSPTGTGKTSYFFEGLVNEYPNKRRIVYLVDTNMLEDSMLHEHRQDMVIYDKRWREDLFLSGNGFGFLKEIENKVVVMSYHKFGFLIQKYPDILNCLDLVVIDEAHNLVKYSEIDIFKLKREYELASDENIEKASKLLNGCSYLAYNIPTFVKNHNIDWLLMTATPSKITKNKEYAGMIYDVLQGTVLKGYDTKNIYIFDNIKNALKLIKKKNDYKILAYAQTIKQCEFLQQQFNSLGFKSVALWSKNNLNRPMSMEQLLTRQYVIENRKLPDTCDVLIINDSMQTGWNLDDELVQLVVCNTSESDTIVQVRGRVRHDIETLMHRGYCNNHKIDSIPDDFIGKELFKEDIVRLEDTLDLYDKKNRKIKWRKIKQLILATGKYEITSRRKQDRNKKYTVHIINNVSTII